MAGLPNTAGIYRIKVDRGAKPPKFYLGQARKMRVRWVTHLRQLRKGNHKNPALQRAFDKHGEDKFVIDVVLICAAQRDVLAMYEQLLLDFHIGAFGNDSVYNTLKKCVTSRLGIKASEETRAKISVKMKAHPPSRACIEASIVVNTGRKLAPESIALRTSKQKGLKRSPETCAALSAALTGKKRSPETCALISIGRSGWEPPLEHVEHLRRLGQSESNRARMRELGKVVGAANAGKKKSPEEMARRTATRRKNAEARGALY